MQSNLQLFALPDHYRDVVDSGTSLLETILPRPYDNTQRIIGLWDCRVKLETNTVNLKTRYRSIWYTEPDSYVEFRPSKQGVCLGMVPDDMVWHNRVLLCTLIADAEVMVQRAHMQNGVVPGNQINQELAILAEHVLEYEIREGSKRLERFPSRDVASQYIKEFIEDDARRKNISIRQVKKADVETLISRYGAGWFGSPEWKEKIIGINDQITKEVRRSATGIGQTLIQQLGALSEPELQQIRTMLGVPAGQSQGQTAAESLDVPLSQRTVEDLRKVARGLGISSAGLRKEDLLDAIIKRQQAQPAGLPEYEQLSEDQQNLQEVS